MKHQDRFQIIVTALKIVNAYHLLVLRIHVYLLVLQLQLGEIMQTDVIVLMILNAIQEIALIIYAHLYSHGGDT